MTSIERESFHHRGNSAAKNSRAAIDIAIAPWDRWVRKTQRSRRIAVAERFGTWLSSNIAAPGAITSSCSESVEVRTGDIAKRSNVPLKS